jgi:hypothetical protein
VIKRISKASALDLTIKGSMGEFAVGAADSSQQSVRVRYLQTYVSLATGGDHQEKLLKMLAPVREIFDTKELDFEQIMQRDIHDGRVSTELIPYLFEAGSSGLVKLFPPIIVVVLPTNSDGLPDSYYPPVEEITEPDSDDSDTEWDVVRSGAVGSEVFEFRQARVGGQLWDHDYATLKINTDRSALVIVDGQHRAMALIALYRNLKGWPDKAKSVEPYYKLWSPSVIKSFQLDSVKLPVMFCVFPQLDGKDEQQLKVYSACRSVFLALNKNARKVTDARNYLLDDRDIVSAMMRSVLTRIKNSSETTSKSFVRLWNIELDADEDRSVISSAAAISGVMHLYHLIQHLMLGTTPGISLSASRQHLSNRSKLDSCFRRLQLTDQLTKAVQQDSRRDSCSAETTQQIVGAFDLLFGRHLVKGLSDFAPYSANNRAALALNERLSTGPTAEFYRSILFEGQGLHRVFGEFVDGFAREVRGFEAASHTELDVLRKEFQDRALNLKKVVSELHRDRIELFLEHLPAPLRSSDAVVKELREVFSNNFTTAAFQSALFITFFAAVDELNEERRMPPNVEHPLTPDEIANEFDAYLASVNKFFTPRTKEGLFNLLRVFAGRVINEESVTIEKWNYTFRSILIPGELKPDEWAKFRVLFLELWKPNHPMLLKLVHSTRESLRKQVLDRYVTRRLREAANQEGIPLTSLDKDKKAEINAQCRQHFLDGLRCLGVKIKDEEIQAASGQAEPETDEDA